MEDKKLSIRMVKQKINKSTTSGKKFYKSYKQQMEHDFRIEKMEEGYLKRPNENNKIIEFSRKEQDRRNTNRENNSNDRRKNFVRGIRSEDIILDWEKIKRHHLKKNGRKLHKQTKPTLNFLLSFSKDFDLSEEEREAQLQSVKNFITKKFSLPIYLVQHNDEKSLHYSFSVMNYDLKNNRPLAKTIDTSFLQDEIANHLKNDNQDYGHTRGIKKGISKSEHLGILQGKVKEQEEIIKQQAKIIEEQKECNEVLNNLKIEMDTLMKLFEGFLLCESDKEKYEQLQKMYQRYSKNENEKRLTTTLKQTKKLLNKVKNKSTM